MTANSRARSQNAFEFELMLGIRAGKKKEVVRIDADWLLGESTDQVERDFSWFMRFFVSLICILVAVWSWPYASKKWLKWEWQQQLAHYSGPQSEDLPILLALNELDPTRTDEMVQQLTRFRINDSMSVAADPLDPPSIRQLQNTASIAATETRPILTSMRTLTGHAEATAPQTKATPLSNMNYSIPRTVSVATLVQTPAVAVEPVEDVVRIEQKVTYRTPEPTKINGIDKRPLEQLLPLLTSSQARIVQQSSNELMRRGMTQPQLELAIDLAQGDAEQRLLAMEAIVRDPELNAIPWLVWMAECGNRDVRRRAIVLLGSMTDPDAMRKLRILQSREPDSAISDQISQVLLASGAVANSVR